MASQPLYFESRRYFVSEMKKVLEEEATATHVGLITTGDSFIASEEKVARIREHFPEVLAVEMEGAAIAQAAHAVGRPYMVIRAMSDTADHEANISFDEFIIQAGERSAQTLMTFLKRLV